MSDVAQALLISEMDHGSEEYLASVELRREVLRRPLGLDFSPGELSQESNSVHLCARDLSGAVLACLMLTPLDQSVVRMRQVAVRPELQGQGLGREIVLFSEAVAQSRGFLNMVLHARESSLGFYERLGYRKSSEPFEEVGLVHYKMEKALETRG